MNQTINTTPLLDFHKVITARKEAAAEFNEKQSKGCDPETMKSAYGLVIKQSYIACFEEGWDAAIKYVIDNYSPTTQTTP